MSINERYEEFLNSPPALKATEAWPLEKFLLWLQQVYRIRDEVGGNRPVWYLFEEIGWPEGARYAYDAMYFHETPVEASVLIQGTRFPHHSRPDERDRIDSRLELRRSHWKKPSKAAFLEAHELLTKSIHQHEHTS